jgi:hypothetical protein
MSTYTKFMAIPNYTYLKLKMQGPNGVITIRTTYQHAYECDIECYEFVEAIIEFEALAINLEECLGDIPDPSSPLVPSNLLRESRRYPSIPIALTARRCVLAPPWIPNGKQCSLSFSAQIATCSDMPGISREVVEHSLDIWAGSKLVRQRLSRFNEESAGQSGRRFTSYWWLDSSRRYSIPSG